jgi:hypothetical protein
MGILLVGHASGIEGKAPFGPAGSRSSGSWVVYSTADTGEGTLRDAIQGAVQGDVITFETTVFPAGSPASIHLSNALPDLVQGHLTIDATGAGVILDGSGLTGDEVGLRVASDGNVVRGLQVLGFPGGGIVLPDSAAENTVQANVISSNGGPCGLGIYGARNIVIGNSIGTGAGGTMDMGNTGHGICIGDSCGNYVGPGNLIAYNGGAGIEVRGITATGNTITQNSITANVSAGIVLEEGANGGLVAPSITVCTETSISGTAPPNCIIEVFSDADAEGETYEGATISDGAGVFSFSQPGGLTGPDITATATDPLGSTSAFSQAASIATEPATWSIIKAAFER